VQSSKNLRTKQNLKLFDFTSIKIFDFILSVSKNIYSDSVHVFIFALSHYVFQKYIF
jgi:hypothetical protein